MNCKRLQTNMTQNVGSVEDLITRMYKVDILNSAKLIVPMS